MSRRKPKTAAATIFTEKKKGTPRARPKRAKAVERRRSVLRMRAILCFSGSPGNEGTRTASRMRDKVVGKKSTLFAME